MILPKNPVKIGVSLSLLALFLTLVLWYIPTYPETDFVNKFVNNFLSLAAFFIAAYWATGLERRVTRR